MPAAVPVCSYTSLESLGVKVKILAEHALGNGCLAWLDVSPAAVNVEAPHGLQDLLIEETGTVARLRVRNRSGKPVLFPSDLVVGGGKQTRTVERSVVVPANADTFIPVRCVERKRWDPGQGAGRFHVEGTLSAPTRTSFFRAKDRALSERRAYRVEQEHVWSEVKDELTRTRVASTTESYADLLRSTRPARPASRAEHERVPTGANAIALAIGDEWAWVEAFASEALLSAQADALLGEFRHRVDALGAPCAGAARAVSEVWRAALLPIDAVEGTSGEPYAVRGARAVGSALFVDAAVAHVAVVLAQR